MHFPKNKNFFQKTLDKQILQVYNIYNTDVGEDNMSKKFKKLPEAELDVMKVIWDWKNETPISTSQIKENLDNVRVLNISAVHTLLTRLVDKGFLQTHKQEKNRHYEPLIAENDYIAWENESFLEKLNGNSITKFITRLYNNKTITKEDLEELALFIDEKTKED
jgi:predicted transcriptional regulator